MPLSPVFHPAACPWLRGPGHSHLLETQHPALRGCWRPRFCRRGECWGLGRAGSGGWSPRVHGCPPRLALSPEASRHRGFVGASHAPAVCREGHRPRCAHHQASALRSRVCLLHTRRPLGIALVPKDTDAGDSPSRGPAVAGEAGCLGASLPPARVREQAGPLSPLRLHSSEPSGTRAPAGGEEAARTSSAGDRGHRLRGCAPAC